ncbi:MAG TPA: hypothetical protein VNO30_31960 [Kofleriaceae bacterium]|nr:hypothetical protein [Kofleriaceae bacterium]
MKFGIERRARSRKAKTGLRALFGGKPPDAREVGDRLVRLARRMFKDAVVDASPKRITLALHPTASPVRLLVLPDGDLELRAETAAVGPAYHADVLERVAPILEELEYVWDGGDGGGGDGGGDGSGGGGDGGDDADPGPRMLAWLAGELAAGATRVGMPAARSFLIDCAVQTAMGPRDAAWRAAVIADPARGADAFAWWDRAPGHRERSRALLAMWHEVAWREPLDDDERRVLERVDADLQAAHRADPELALPWREWDEVLGHLGEGGEHAAEVAARARAAEAAADAAAGADAAAEAPRIGYRRHPMEIELSGGWSLELSGAFVGRWEQEGDRWWATDGARVVEFTSLTAEAETDSDRLLAVAPEAHPVLERLASRDHRGRAEVTDDGDIHIVHGLMARAPHVAILTCKGARADEEWALATWRSLRNT